MLHHIQPHKLSLLGDPLTRKPRYVLCSVCQSVRCTLLHTEYTIYIVPIDNVLQSHSHNAQCLTLWKETIYNLNLISYSVVWLSAWYIRRKVLWDEALQSVCLSVRPFVLCRLGSDNAPIFSARWCTRVRFRARITVPGVTVPPFWCIMRWQSNCVVAYPSSSCKLCLFGCYRTQPSTIHVVISDRSPVVSI